MFVTIRHRTWVLAAAASIVGLLALAGLLSSRVAAQGSGSSLPKPRAPRYLVKPSSADLTRAARVVVRQPHGMSPLGRMQSGQRVYVFHEYGQDMQAWDAIKKAWAERSVEAIAIGGWELAGLTKDAYEARAKKNLLHGEEGWKELGVFDPVFLPFFPPDVQKVFGEPLTFFATIPNLRGYLDKHPEIEHFYQAPGGQSGVRMMAGPKHAGKFMGSWIYSTKLELMEKASEFPADVWNLVEDQLVKPIPHVSEGTFTDPQGTRLHWLVTPQQAQTWAKSGSQANHLLLYPMGANATWKEGVLRSTANHTGFYPLMTVRLNEHGRVVSIEGGGRTGDLFRTLVDNPKFKAARFPTAPEPGYWFLNADGFATNPKHVRDMDMLIQGDVNYANRSERERAGVQHMSFMPPVRYPNYDPLDVEYAKAQGLPLAHTAHLHMYFPTYRWRLADTGEWITLAENGFIKAFENPEVRALAARYGNPDLMFRYEWIPGIPGLNLPGDHARDYAADPWSWIMKEWAQIQSGKYEHYVEDYQLSPPPG